MNKIDKQAARQHFELLFSTLMSKEDYASMSFYSFIISKMKIHFTDSVPTAGVNWKNKKYNLYINPEFFDSLSKNEGIGVLIHESLHAMLNHIHRQGERD